VLGSGSRGNAVLLECGESRLLVDAGFSPRVLASRLAKAGVAPESIEACVVTHEHTDHVSGAGAAAARWGWAIYATEGTARAVPALAGADVRTFEAGATLRVGAWEVRTVRSSHDAEDPVVLVATASSGARVGVCYDLGVVSDAVRSTFADLDILVLESNHDEGMLRAGPYPPSLVSRIASRHGHLSNRAAGAMARECATPGLSTLVLAHLSEKCNEPALAQRAMRAALAGSRFRGAVHAASQRDVVGPFTPSGLPQPTPPRTPARAPGQMQLSLGL
jgi:phosphoribosyl 1,2-cyclic phosphodiesterase